MYSVFEPNDVKHVDKKLFLDEFVDIARYDVVKYPFLEKLTEKQAGFFWRPQEIECIRDGKDFKQLSDVEKHIFTSNLKRQILLDSVQGRAPSLAFLPIASLPELENWIQTWAYFETIHSRSYSHIIRNVYNDSSVVFDEMLNIPEIIDCATDISKYYNDLIYWNNRREQYVKSEKWSDSVEGYQHKKALWMALNAVNALEGIRFYVSFICSWAFAELKKMEGNAKIIKLIARDENLHLASTQQLLRILPKDDPDFAKIQEEMSEQVLQMFKDVVDQEIQWANYLFKDGQILGLNIELLKQYVDFLAYKRCTAIGIKQSYWKKVDDPLPWSQKWIAGSDVQDTPQEVNIVSYTVGEIQQDVEEDTFKNFEL